MIDNQLSGMHKDIGESRGSDLLPGFWPKIINRFLRFGWLDYES